MSYFYEPSEDTDILIEAINKFCKEKNISQSLEIGVGNGQVSKVLCDISSTHIGVDINPYAIKETKTVAPKGEYFESDLFSRVEEKFDLVVFNPPYLPEMKDEEDNWEKKALVGGKKGYEIIIKCIDQLEKHLKSNGHFLLLFTTHSKPEFILDYINKQQYCADLLIKKSIMMEEFFVYDIYKKDIRTLLESNGYSHITYFAKGSHGVIVKANHSDKKLAVKIKKEDSAADEVIANEAEKLKFVNSLGIGPTLFEEHKRYISYSFVEGTPWHPYFETAQLSEIKSIMLHLLEQCHKMDKAGFEKKEMKRPIKNVIISKGKPVLLDFERGIFKNRCGNVTQFLQYVVVSKFAHFIEKEFGIVFEQKRIVELSKKYLKSYDLDSIREYVKDTFEQLT